MLKMSSAQSENHKFLIQIFSMCFGFGSWIAMTGLWVELPLLTQKLPESWALGSYLTVMIQLANIGPLIYWYARVNRICSEVTAIHVQMVIGSLSCIALIFWWDTTAFVFGAERSIVLLLASFGLSIVDCTSSVVFLPYMARFKAHHMTPYLIGEGLSGFLPSLVALAQGVTEEVESDCPSNNGTEIPITTTADRQGIRSIIQQPRFSANIFFCILLLILCLSWIAFTLMDVLHICRSERIDEKQLEKLRGKGIDENKNNDEDEMTQLSPTVNPAVIFPSSKTITEVEKGFVRSTSSTFGNNRNKFIWLFVLMGWGCFTTFGAMPSIQSYSCLPYGAATFFYAVTLAGLAYPAACLIGFFFEIRAPSVLNTFTVIGSGIGVYILICGLLSPDPPLKDEAAGSVIMVMSWLMYVGLISYMKTMVSLELNDIGGNKAMFWCGLAQQFGAASGGALIFCIINFTNVFKEENNCSE